MDPDSARDFITQTAEKAGSIIMEYHGRDFSVEFKGRIDAVTEADKASERFILSEIERQYPGHSVQAEESGAREGSEYLWLIDPLDGTTNFTHGFPVFGVSLALYKDRRPLAGCVHDPLRKETFFAFKGEGAWLNGRQINVSSVERLDRALVATGFPYEKQGPGNNLDNFNRMMPKLMGVRRAGAASLDLAYVAAGRLDGFWELGLKPWDTAAGILLVEEAGGTATDMHGGPYDPWQDNILTSNGKLHGEMLDVFNAEE